MPSLLFMKTFRGTTKLGFNFKTSRFLWIFNLLLGSILADMKCNITQIMDQGCSYMNKNIVQDFYCQDNGQPVFCVTETDCLEEFVCKKLWFNKGDEMCNGQKVLIQGICMKGEQIYKEIVTYTIRPNDNTDRAKVDHGHNDYDDQDVHESNSLLPIIVFTIVIVVSIVFIGYCRKQLNQRRFAERPQSISALPIVVQSHSQTQQIRPILSGTSTSPPREYPRFLTHIAPSSDVSSVPDVPPPYSALPEIPVIEPPSYEESVNSTVTEKVS